MTIMACDKVLLRGCDCGVDLLSLTVRTLSIKTMITLRSC